MKKVKLFLCILCSEILCLYGQSLGVNYVSPPTVEGDRLLQFQIDHPGIATSDIKAVVYYSDNASVLNNLEGAGFSHGNAIIKPSTANSSEAVFVFPHEDHPQGPNRDYYLGMKRKNINVNTQASVPFPSGAGPLDASSIDIRPVIYRNNQCVYYRIIAVSIEKKASNYISEVMSFRMPDTYNIGIVGDSYGSGEGAPDQNKTDTRAAVWTHNDCHRSNRSGLVVGVKEFIHEHPEVAVDYLHTACSGAIIENLVSQTQQKGNNAVTIQFEQLQQNLLTERGHDKLHLLLMSIGGNNAGFADFVLNYLILPVNVTASPLVQFMQANAINEDLANLAVNYDALNTSIRNTFPGVQVCLTTYPDPTNGPRGRCGRSNNPADFLSVYSCCLSEVDIVTNPESEFNFSSASFLRPLNQAVRNAAQRNAWNVMDMESRMGTHGLCDCENPFINRMAMSFAQQGDIYGICHPNATGFSEVYPDLVKSNILSRYENFKAGMTFARIFGIEPFPQVCEIPKPITPIGLFINAERFKLLGKLRKVSWVSAFFDSPEMKDLLKNADEKNILNTEAYKKLMGNKSEAVKLFNEIVPPKGTKPVNPEALKVSKEVKAFHEFTLKQMESKETLEMIEKAKSDAKKVKPLVQSSPLSKYYNRKTSN